MTSSVHDIIVDIIRVDSVSSRIDVSRTQGKGKESYLLEGSD